MSTDSRYYIKKDLFDELIYNIDKISQEISESSLSDKQLDNDVLQYELDKLNEFTRYMNSNKFYQFLHTFEVCFEVLGKTT